MGEAHEAEMTVAPPTVAPAARSAAAERMRLHRERRRKGLRCLLIELRETEIDVLIRMRLLNPERRRRRRTNQLAPPPLLPRGPR